MLLQRVELTFLKRHRSPSEDVDQPLVFRGMFSASVFPGGLWRLRVPSRRIYKSGLDLYHCLGKKTRENYGFERTNHCTGTNGHAADEYRKDSGRDCIELLSDLRTRESRSRWRDRTFLPRPATPYFPNYFTQREARTTTEGWQKHGAGSTAQGHQTGVTAVFFGSSSRPVMVSAKVSIRKGF